MIAIPGLIFANDATLDAKFVAETGDSVGVTTGEAAGQDGDSGEGCRGEADGKVAEGGEAVKVCNNSGKIFECSGKVNGEVGKEIGGVEMEIKVSY